MRTCVRGRAALMATYLTVEQCAEIAHVQRWTVRAWIRAGVLPAYRLPGRRRLLVDAQALESVIRSGAVRPAAEGGAQ